MSYPSQSKEAEYQFLSDSRKIVGGVTVYEKKHKEKGKIIFSLGELQKGINYITESGATLERKTDNEVLYDGKKKLYVKPLEELLGPSPNRSGATSWGGGGGSYQNNNNSNQPDHVETKKLVLQAEKTAADSHAAMKRMIRLTDETQQVANGTLARLDEQGEQIRRMQDDVDTMEQNFDKADRELKTIGSLWGQIGNSMSSYKQKDRETNAKIDKVQGKEITKRDKARTKEEKKEEKKQKKLLKKRKGVQPSQELPAEISVLSPQAQSQVRETDQMLDALGSAVANLKGAAIRMGDEVGTQNQRLDVLNQSIENSDMRMRRTNHQVKRMI